MHRYFIPLAALSAALAVGAGAFGAHALRDLVAPERLETFEIGVRYQMYHALALLVVGVLIGQAPKPPAALALAGWLFVAGTLIFSGSLYVLVLSGVRWLGAITPIGGVAFLAGWLALAWAALRR
jgi:uncharacterized membrane protein YgdD (TMEM256/DUF423 family)